MLVFIAATGKIATAALLERWTGKQAASIYADIRAGNTSRDKQMHLTGVSPGKVGDGIRKLVR